MIDDSEGCDDCRKKEPASQPNISTTGRLWYSPHAQVLASTEVKEAEGMREVLDPGGHEAKTICTI
jgi:hypothetical protein